MTSDPLYSKLFSLKIHPKNVVVFGSSSIALRFHDFRCVGDIDLVVSGGEFLRLWLLHHWKLVLPEKGKSWKECRLISGNIEVFLFWKMGDHHISYTKVKQHSHFSSLLSLVDIDWVKRYKRALHREKDIRDLAFLRLHGV